MKKKLTRRQLLKYTGIGIGGLGALVVGQKAGLFSRLFDPPRATAPATEIEEPGFSYADAKAQIRTSLLASDVVEYPSVLAFVDSYAALLWNQRLTLKQSLYPFSGVNDSEELARLKLMVESLVNEVHRDMASAKEHGWSFDSKRTLRHA